MKILHFHTSMQGGGIESMICGLANEMVEQGHDVSVCTIFAPQTSDVFWNQLDPRVKKFDLGKTSPGFSIKEVFKIRQFIRKGGFEVVQLHGFFYYYFFSIFTLRNVKFFYTVHSDAFMENNSREKIVLPLKKFAFKHDYLHAITISKASQDSFEKLYQSKNCLIYNGIRKPVVDYSPNIVDESRINQTTRVFLHPGRISTPKNQMVLVKVFDRLIKEGEDVVLLIAGSLQMQDIFDSIKPYFNERIKYVGERSNIPSLLHKADGFCLPSLWEGMPVTLIESFAVGCIPLCSPVGGIVDVVENGINGFLSKTSNEEDYYNTVRDFLSCDKNKLEKIKNNSRETFKQFEISSVVSNYINYYKI